jgi:CRISPR system Cascade subunit CasE
MYLSRVILNPEHPEALRALGNPYRLHQLLWRAFPHREEGGAGRVLFRVEDQRSIPAPIVLVQSDLAPDWSALGTLKTAAANREFTPRLAAGQTLRFRLRANPTKRVGADKADDKLAGKRVQLFGEENQLEWLRRQGERHGFALLDCRVSGVETQRSRKGDGSEMRHQAVTFDGLLRVTDPAAFLAALETGIGPAKGFGCGLLSVARG